MINPRIENKVALVTGGNAGIGASIAKTLAGQGAKVIIHYLDPTDLASSSDSSSSVEHTMKGKEAANKAVESITNAGGYASSVSGDLGAPLTVQKLYDFAEDEFGPIEILINNAAHCELPDTIKELPLGSIDRHFKINTKAAVQLIHEFVLRAQRHKLSSGRIVNISTHAAQCFPNQISYGASKAALEAYTRSLAVELGPDNITVNCIAPGPIQTGWIDEELKQQILESIPIKRIGIPDDIANTVLFFVSNQASWISGQVIKVSGGYSKDFFVG